MTKKQTREHKQGNQLRKQSTLTRWEDACAERRTNPKKFIGFAPLTSPRLVQDGKYS